MIKFTQRLGALVFFYGIYNPIVYADQVVQDDQVVVGSGCFGMDCVNGESFGFDTIRLKENNLRIKFMDTSSSASFPTTDWQITANDSANGGLNKFSIDDIDSGRTPFTIIQSAPSNSLYVKDNGFIGFNTSTPVVNLHLKYGNSPALRLEQDGSSGFTAQTWDIAGNETNFFIRDATNSSKLPFKIKPGASNNSLFIAADGDIGLETASPDGQLDIAHALDANRHALLVGPASNVGINIDNSGDALRGLFDVRLAGNNTMFLVESDGDVGLGTKNVGVNGRFDIRSQDAGNSYFNVDADGDIGIGTINPVGRFEVTSIGGASSYLNVNASGNVGVGTNGPTAALDITKADATVLVKDTTVGAEDVRSLLTLESEYGTKLTFLNRQNSLADWAIGTNKNNSSFLISRPDSGINSLFVNDSKFVFRDVNNDTLMKSDVSGITISGGGTFGGDITVNGTIVHTSSRTVKDNIVSVEPDKVLEMLSGLDIAKWNYIQDGEEVKHIGPIAEDFYALFGLGRDEKHITTLDTSGIALAAIKALSSNSNEKDDKIEALQLQNKELTDKVMMIEKILNQLLK